MNFTSPNARLWQSRILSVLRVVAALVLMQHGSQKMFHFPSAGGATGPAAPYVLMSLTGVAGILETFGGFASLIGLFTRPIAFILCGEMAVAYFRFHYPRAFMPILNRGEVPVLLCFIFLYLVFAGAGVWSVDSLIKSSRRPNAAPTPGAPT
jgi:putative oxidoreductase